MASGIYQYSSGFSRLDLDKIESVLPAMKKKAREMMATGEELTGHPGLPLETTPNLVPN